MDFESRREHCRQSIEAAIEQLIPPRTTHPKRIHEAMWYSLKAGGKRTRPLLLLAAFELSPSKQDPLPAAVAVECLHTYSLIHDDLPSIDNSDWRRGHPTCHKQFDEPTAILAGDALLTQAFEILSSRYQDVPNVTNELVYELSRAAGSTQLIGGQIEDITADPQTLTQDQLTFIHRGKAAALIVASLTMGVILSAASDAVLEPIRSIGLDVGLAFQLIDDVLDLTATSALLGKPTFQDKVTAVRLYGLETCRQRAKQHTQKALAACSKIGGNPGFLMQLIESLESRIY